MTRTNLPRDMQTWFCARLACTCIHTIGLTDTPTPWQAAPHTLTERRRPAWRTSAAGAITSRPRRRRVLHGVAAGPRRSGLCGDRDGSVKGRAQSRPRFHLPVVCPGWYRTTSSGPARPRPDHRAYSRRQAVVCPSWSLARRLRGATCAPIRLWPQEQASILVDTQTNKQVNILVDEQTSEYFSKRKNKGQASKQSNKHSFIQTNMQMDEQANTQANKQANQSTSKHANVREPEC